MSSVITARTPPQVMKVRRPQKETKALFKCMDFTAIRIPHTASKPAVEVIGAT